MLSARLKWAKSGQDSWRRGSELHPSSKRIEFGTFWDLKIASEW